MAIACRSPLFLSTAGFLLFLLGVDKTPGRSHAHRQGLSDLLLFLSSLVHHTPGYISACTHTHTSTCDHETSWSARLPSESNIWSLAPPLRRRGNMYNNILLSPRLLANVFCQKHISRFYRSHFILFHKMSCVMSSRDQWRHDSFVAAHTCTKLHPHGAAAAIKVVFLILHTFIYRV